MISPAAIANKLPVTPMALRNATQYWHLREVLLNGNQHLKSNANATMQDWSCSNFQSKTPQTFRVT